MGVFDFLKKKKDQSVVNTSMPSPEEIKQQVLEKDDLKSINDIPLPPQTEAQSSEATSAPEDKPLSETTSEPIQDISTPVDDIAPTTDNSVEEFDKRFEVPSDIPTPEEITETFPKETPETTMAEPVEQTTEMPTPETPVESEPIEAQSSEATSAPEDKPVNETDGEFSLPDFSDEKLSGQTREAMGDESSETVLSETEEKFLDAKNCQSIFSNISEGQKIIANINKSFNKVETKNKTNLQNLRNLHTHLDLAQENLMKIDKSLFER